VIEPRSAIVVAFSLPAEVETIRRAEVPVAHRGVPPHVTILMPFAAAASLSAEIRSHLAAIAAETPAFAVRFASTSSFPDALYLVPDPFEPFRHLTMSVVHGFPAYPPYGEPIADPAAIVPHLTIADADPERFPFLATAIEPFLPFVRTARSLTVLAEQPDGRWRACWQLPFRR
jgi:2'-5' RNA ligase